MNYIFVNNKILSEEKAFVSVKERGFRFGDGVFETCRIKNRKICYYKIHLKRLEEGLRAVRIKVDIGDLDKNCQKLIEKNNLTNGILRISISRGIGSIGYMPTYESKALIIIETSDLPKKPSGSINLWVSKITKPSLSSLPINCKISQGLNSTLAKMEAVDNGCFDSLLLNDKGEICETASANIFWIKDDALYTPDKECGILLGTTRHRLIEKSPIKVIFTRSPIKDILEADEVFITNVSFGVLGIDVINPQKRKFTYKKYFKIFEDLVNPKNGDRKLI